jgi:hypothetical protein
LTEAGMKTRHSSEILKLYDSSALWDVTTHRPQTHVNHCLRQIFTCAWNLRRK